jgi:predicted amino acid dehydrogenase
MVSILGADGVIADELVKELAAHSTEPIRLVSRNSEQLPGRAGRRRLAVSAKSVRATAGLR